MAKNKENQVPTETNDTGSKTYALQRFEENPAMADMLKGFEKKGLAPIVKPREMTDGSFIAGRLLDVMPSPKAEFKGNLLLIHLFKPGSTTELTEPANEVAFPVTGFVASAVGKDMETQKKNIGFDIILVKKGTKKAEGKKKAAHIIETLLRDPNKKALKK